MRFIVLLIISFLSLSVAADNTTRKKLHRTEKYDSTEMRSDTVTLTKEAVRLSGYEKPLRSTKESVFLTNQSDKKLVYVKLLLDYYDEDGRQLHQREVELNCDVPAHETRQLIFPSWDKQKTFYYYLSSKPKSALGTPYKVKTTALTGVFMK